MHKILVTNPAGTPSAVSVSNGRDFLHACTEHLTLGSDTLLRGKWINVRLSVASISNTVNGAELGGTQHEEVLCLPQ